LFDLPAFDRSVAELGLTANLTLNFTTDYASYTNGYILLEIPKDCMTFNTTLVP